MDKRKIKIKFVDVEREVAGSLGESFGIDKIILRALNTNFIINESDNPDYIFCFNPIDTVEGVEYTKYPNAVRIQVAQEAVRPEFNNFDYCIGLYPEISYPDRYLYIPCSVLYGQSAGKSYEEMRKKHINAGKEAADRAFCSFVVSNPNALTRLEFFKKLCSYKKVDSGGKCCNNIGYLVDDKVAFESKHKFSIAFENTYYGVTTERIDMAFAAGTVPIYWGNPLVGTVYNEKAFVNCHNFDSFEEVVKRIQEIDSDDEEYMRMIHERALIVDKSSDDYVKELAEFLKKIIETPRELAIWRSSEGYPAKNEIIRKLGFETYHKMQKRNRKIEFVARITPKFLRKLPIAKRIKKRFWV